MSAENARLDTDMHFATPSRVVNYSATGRSVTINDPRGGTSAPLRSRNSAMTTTSGSSFKQPWYLQTLFIIGLVGTLIIVLALGIGLGVGLNERHTSNLSTQGGSSSDPSSVAQGGSSSSTLLLTKTLPGSVTVVQSIVTVSAQQSTVIVTQTGTAATVTVGAASSETETSVVSETATVSTFVSAKTSTITVHQTVVTGTFTVTLTQSDSTTTITRTFLSTQLETVTAAKRSRSRRRLA